LVAKRAKSGHVLTCSANTVVPPGGVITATAIAAIPASDAARSACGNVANSATLTVPLSIGPVWAHATLPPSSGCSPSSTTTDGVVPPACPFAWHEVADQARLPRSWRTQRVSMNGVTILCAKPHTIVPTNPTLSNTVLVPLILPKIVLCNPPTVLINGQCVPPPPPCPNGPRTASGACPPLITQPVTYYCPDGKPMPPDGTCLKPHVKIDRARCADGQLRLLNGACPAAPNLSNIVQQPKSKLGPKGTGNLQKCADGSLAAANQPCPSRNSGMANPGNSLNLLRLKRSGTPAIEQPN
jgi:hypothetical protein